MEQPKDISSMLVRDMMSVGVPVCSPDASILSISETILQGNHEAIVVLDESGHAVGFIDQQQLIRVFSKGYTNSADAESIMQVDVPEVPADIPVEAAVKLMLDQNCRVLFITHHAGGKKYPAGMLTYRQIILFLAYQDPTELGVQAKRKTPLELFQERHDAARKKNLGT